MTSPTGEPSPAAPGKTGATQTDAAQTDASQTGSGNGRGRWPESGMRVSDAERAIIADRLAKHFSDGRLDQAEFDDRLDRAMRAKTRADLVGLLTDLPEGLPVSPADDPERSRNQRRRERQLLKVQ